MSYQSPSSDPPSVAWIVKISSLTGYPWSKCPICGYEDLRCSHNIVQRAEAYFGKERWAVTKELLK